MKAWGMASTAVLALIPAAALYWQGTFSSTASMAEVQPVQPIADVQPVQPEPASQPAPTVAANTTQAPTETSVLAPVSHPSGSTRSFPSSSLEAAVSQAMANFPGTYSVAVQELSSGQRWVRGGDSRYHPASTIKMVVSLYALEQYRAGKLRWQDSITYTKADYESPGGGALEEAPYGSQYSIENLVNRALQNSNNIAVNMLGRDLGWDNIRTWSRSVGGELYRDPDGSPAVTVLSELSWWLHLEQLSKSDPKAAELLLTPLRNVTYADRIPAGLPQGVPYLHKFGSYNGYFHDGGIVYAPQPYALVVLTAGGTVSQADEAIARVSAAVYKVLTE